MLTSTYDELKREVEYVLKGCSITFAHEVYGKIKMARHLNAISYDEFMELNHSIVYDFINQPQKWQ